MSQLKVDTITNEAGTGSPSLPNGLTVGGVNYPSTGPLSNRNKIINGAMEIAQRGTTATPTGGGYFTVDRVRNGGTGAVTVAIAPVTEQSTNAPAGFKNSFLWTNTNGVSALTGTNNIQILQNIEGHNISDLSWGTSDAQTVTLSFWVRSSLTGTFSGSFRNSAIDRSYPFIYSIAAANTWEYKTVTVEGDTSGTWLTDSGIGIRLNFALGSGPDSLGTAGAWAAASLLGATGQVQLVETSGATWQITGVQLEAGTVATPFEHRSFGQELALCQRYYEEGTYRQVLPVTNASVVNSYETWTTFKATKRATPTITGTNSQGSFSSSGAAVDGVALGRSDAVTNRNNTGTYTADAEL
jgi:hypothetical protein